MSEATIGLAIREVYPRVLSRVLGSVRRLHVAEDAVHDAVTRALERWPIDGMPDSVEAWLVAVALNRQRDVARHERRVDLHIDTVALVTVPAGRALPLEALPWDDDLLRLLVTACDPELTDADAAALTLATVLGLSTREIAAAFLVEERAMEQRLVRARRRLRDAEREYDVPAPNAAAARLRPALTAIYLVFNEGYWSHGADGPIRPVLCGLALDLARSLHRLVPDAEVAALLVLMELHEARRATRLDEAGTPVPLPEQDRARWDRSRIDAAAALLARTAADEPDGPIRIEARIALAHASARAAADTPWPAIASDYAALEHLRRTAVVRVNRAFAVARADGPAEGLRLLEGVEAPYAALVRGVLLAELGRDGDARAALDEARAGATNTHVLREIDRRLATLRSGAQR